MPTADNVWTGNKFVLPQGEDAQSVYSKDNNGIPKNGTLTRNPGQIQAANFVQVNNNQQNEFLYRSDLQHPFTVSNPNIRSRVYQLFFGFDFLVVKIHSKCSDKIIIFLFTFKFKTSTSDLLWDI